MFSKLRDDGVTELHIEPPDYIKHLPTYQMWKGLLKSRPNHATLDGSNEVKLACICCGLLWSQLSMKQVRIGALIRIEREYPTKNPKEVLVRTHAIPVTKKGLGCPVCQDLYTRQMEVTSKENKVASELAQLQAKLAVLNQQAIRNFEHPDTCMQVKLPSSREPWVDISECLK